MRDYRVLEPEVRLHANVLTVKRSGRDLACIR